MSPALSSPSLRIVLFEGAGSRPVAASDRFVMMSTLLQRGYAVTSVRHGDPVAPAGLRGPFAVLGRFEATPPREAHDEATGDRVFFRDLEGTPPDGVTALVEGLQTESGTSRPGGWKPWFPVIDYGRCTNCMQCLSFCLFDVYGVSADKQIRVQNPSNCKTDCPACSRVCPEVAILFPKYKMGPINGDEVRAEDIHREKMKVDISALLGGDIYAALRQRSVDAKQRFLRERDDKRALEERRKCLAKLQQQLDIPPEVLLALPSQDQIRAKAERAFARAEGLPGGLPAAPEEA
jgi:NAD-dependent dihydropyrimidine dehydrogenase PreA subunit